MGNVALVNSALQLRTPGTTGMALVVVGPDDVDFATLPGGTVGPGTPGSVAVFTGANAVGNSLAGTDTTFNVPNGQVGVFALNGVSLVRFTGAGFSPTVSGGVASGDAAHYWANVYGRNILSDIDMGVEAGAASKVLLRVNGATILQIPAPVAPTTWTWPTVDVAGAQLQSDGAGNLSFVVGGGFPYPSAPPASPNANNEEFTSTLGGFAVVTALASGNTDDVGVNVNSRLLVHIVANTNDVLRIDKTLSGVWTGDISVTAQLSLGSFGNFVTAEVGFLAAGLNSGFMVAVNNDGSVALRNYSNWTAATFANLFTVASVFDVSKKVPFACYVHLQRVGGTWSVWISPDCADWFRLGTNATALAVVGSGLLLAGFGATAPYVMGCDFVRYNWLTLP